VLNLDPSISATNHGAYGYQDNIEEQMLNAVLSTRVIKRTKDL